MKIRIRTHDEFLLNRLLDGDLDAVQEAQLRRRMEVEPHLKAAFDRLVRLDAALKACRRQTPDVDLAAFHERLMQAVARERASSIRTIRIPWPVWAMVPLAAAAAVALIVWPHVLTDTGRSAPSPLVRAPQPVSTVDDAAVSGRNEAAPSSGQLAVRFAKPVETVETPAAGGTIRVSYARSPELAERVRARDTAELAAPANFVYIAGVERDRTDYRALLDAAAL